MEIISYKQLFRQFYSYLLPVCNQDYNYSSSRYFRIFLRKIGYIIFFYGFKSPTLIVFYY